MKSNQCILSGDSRLSPPSKAHGFLKGVQKHHRLLDLIRVYNQLLKKATYDEKMYY
jgi:hypothetical protein